MFITKVTYKTSADEGTTRRFVVEEPYTYAQLWEIVAKRFELAEGAVGHLRYTDPDGDLVTVNTDEELKEALQLIQDQETPLLRMQLCVAEGKENGAAGAPAVNANAWAGALTDARLSIASEDSCVVVSDQVVESEKAEEEAKLKAEKEAEEARQKAEAEAEAISKAEAEEKARLEAEAALEAERQAAEQARKEEELRMEAERAAAEKAAAEKEAAEKAVREEAERQAAAIAAAEAAEKAAREEAERQAAAEKAAREAAELKAAEEKAAREAAERKARAEAEKKAKEEAERKAADAEALRIEEENERQARLQIALAQAEEEAYLRIDSLVKMGCSEAQLKAIYAPAVVAQFAHAFSAQAQAMAEVEAVEQAEVRAMSEPVVDWEAAKAEAEQEEEESVSSQIDQERVDAVGDLAAKLTAFYWEHNQGGLDKVSQLVADFASDEESLNVLLRAKYGCDLTSLEMPPARSSPAPSVESAPLPQGNVQGNIVVPEPQPEFCDAESVEAPPPAQSAAEQQAEEEDHLPQEVVEALAVLVGMGFEDRDMNLSLLSKHNSDVQAVVNEYLGA